MGVTIKCGWDMEWDGRRDKMGNEMKYDGMWDVGLGTKFMVR